MSLKLEEKTSSLTAGKSYYYCIITVFASPVCQYYDDKVEKISLLIRKLIEMCWL